MCGLVRYIASDDQNKELIIGFGNPYASLPARHPLSPNGVDWLLWGNRDNHIEAQGLPVTGWARQDMITKGAWEKYNPEFVNIAIQQFCEKGDDGSRYWFDIEDGYAIKGVIAHSAFSSRLFIVTTPVPNELSYVHDRWPKIVSVSNNEILGKLNNGYRLNIPLSRKHRNVLAA